MKTYASLLTCLLLLASCQEKTENTEASSTSDTTANATTTTGDVAEDGEFCYLKVISKDSIILRYNRNGEHVSGIFHWRPYEKDKKISSFEGTIKGNTVNAIGHYDAEGMHFKEELIFTIKDNQALVKFGEMLQGDDEVWRYKSIKNAGVQVLPKVDCEQIASYK